MSEPQNIELWCVHVYGPDDLHAMPDYATAIDAANKQNVIFIQLRERSGWNENDPHMMAVAEPWPGGADGHAKSVADDQLGLREAKPQTAS